MKTYLKKYSLISFLFPLQLLSMQQQPPQSNAISGTSDLNFTEEEMGIISFLTKRLEDPSAHSGKKEISSNQTTLSEGETNKVNHDYYYAEDESSDDKVHDEDGSDSNYFKDQIERAIQRYAQNQSCAVDIKKLLKDTPPKIYSQPCFEHGATLLHLAAHEGMFTIIKACVENYGFDPLAQDSHGKTPLYYAAQIQNEKPQAFKYLNRFAKSKKRITSDGEENIISIVRTTQLPMEMGRPRNIQELIPI